MIRKHPTVTTLLVVCLLLTTGCLGFLTGDEPLSVEADPATVNDDTLSTTEYELSRDASPEVNSTVSVADQERTVKATSHLREYERTTDLVATDVAITRFVVLSTPKAEVAGESMNPIGEWSKSRLIERFLQSYEGIGDPTPEGNRTTTALGGERTVATYSASAQIAGGIEIPITIHVATFDHGDDYITVIAVNPSDLDEQQRIDQLLANLEHPA